MAKVTAVLSHITAADANNKRTAHFAPGNGVPHWAGVKPDGQINMDGPGAAQADIIFELPEEGSPVTFDQTTPWTLVGDTKGDFSVTKTESLSITVEDKNSCGGEKPEYTLHFSDRTFIDPRVINRN
jgi:hypothetical protein